MFDEADVDGGTREQPARQHSNEFRNLTQHSIFVFSRCFLAPGLAPFSMRGMRGFDPLEEVTPGCACLARSPWVYLGGRQRGLSRCCC